MNLLSVWNLLQELARKLREIFDSHYTICIYIIFIDIIDIIYIYILYISVYLHNLTYTFLFNAVNPKPKVLST